MGSSMAANLQRYLTEKNEAGLIYHNRTISKGKHLDALGASAAPSIESLIDECDLVFSCVANDASIQQITDNMVNSKNLVGTLVVDCSTVLPETAIAVSKKLTSAGARFVHSPVFGAAPVAAAGKLLFIPSGDAEDIKAFTPYALSMGRRVLPLGSDLSKSSTLKLIGNSFVLSLMEIIGEGLVFAEAAGFDSDVYPDLIADIFGATIGSYAARISKGSYVPPEGTAPGFSAKNALKDINHALELAKKANVKLPALEVSKSNVEKAIELKGEHLDGAAMYGTLRNAAGLDFENEAIKQRDSK